MNKIKYYLKRIFCHVFIFLFSGTVYYLMEVLFKDTHSSHWTMFLLAGFSALFFIDGLNDLFGYDMDYLLQCIICATAITIGELCIGLIWNFDYGIWDYRNMPLNFKGQICLPFYWIISNGNGLTMKSIILHIIKFSEKLYLDLVVIDKWQY